MYRLVFFLCLLVSSWVFSAEESFYFSFPSKKEWVIRSFNPQGKLILIPKTKEALSSKESLTVEWTQSSHVNAKEVKAKLLDRKRLQKAPCTIRSLTSRGETQSFEIRESHSDRTPYHLLTITKAPPFLISMHYYHENLENYLDLRELLKSTFENINSSNGRFLKVSSEGVFINDTKVEYADNELSLTLEQEPFIFYLPKHWDIRNKQNRRDPYFTKTSKFVVGFCEEGLNFSIKRFEEYSIEGLLKGKKIRTFTANDGKEIRYTTQRLKKGQAYLRAYIPGPYEVYQLEVTGSYDKLKREFPYIKRVLKLCSTVWTTQE